MKRKAWFALMLLAALSIIAAQCAPTSTPGVIAVPETEASEAPTDVPTEVPTEVIEASVEATEEPAPTEPLIFPDVLLPQMVVKRLVEVAEQSGLKFVSLSAENTVIYALPDSGVAFLLTPAAEWPNFSAPRLAEEPASIEKLMLGSLTVVQSLDEALPPGDYIMTLAPDGKTVIFTGGNSQAQYEAVIRELPRPVPRPLALITAQQMCLAWGTTQICALVSTPLPDDLAERVQAAMENLGVRAFPSSPAVPDIEGVEALERCAKALSQEPPNYGDCRSTVLASRADGAETSKRLADASTTAIGVLLVLQPIREEIFLDPKLTQPTPILPVGEFATFEVKYPDDPQIDEGIFETRVLQSGEAGDFYLPSISGAVIIGDPVLGDGPSNEDETIIANLWVDSVCYFKRWQCPWLQ
jgi:hypothetical protein